MENNLKLTIMETLICTYQNVKYENHNSVPFDKEDQKFIKQIAQWGKPDRLKDKRAPKIQHCYALILRKGMKTIPQIPDKRWLTWDDLRPIERRLEINCDPKAYLEPLRVAQNIYLETYSL